MIGDIWYRYVDEHLSDNWEQSRIHMREYAVISETLKTVVLVEKYYAPTEWRPEPPAWAKRHRVLKDARRRFAYPTKALALNSYRKRKHYQIARLTWQLEHATACRAAVAIIEGLLS